MWQAKAHTELTLSPLPATAVGQSLLKYGTTYIGWSFWIFLVLCYICWEIAQCFITFHSLRTQDMRQQPHVQQFYRWWSLSSSRLWSVCPEEWRSPRRCWQRKNRWRPSYQAHFGQQQFRYDLFPTFVLQGEAKFWHYVLEYYIASQSQAFVRKTENAENFNNSAQERN